MDTGEKVFMGILILIGLLSAVIGMVGLHINTGNGEHTGYVTAVETSGVFFKTHRAFIKTDTQSSQEDAYCVIDPTVFAELENVSKKKTLVTVKYFDWFSKGITNCGGEAGGIINGVSTL